MLMTEFEILKHFCSLCYISCVSNVKSVLIKEYQALPFINRRAMNEKKDFVEDYIWNLVSFVSILQCFACFCSLLYLENNRHYFLTGPRIKTRLTLIIAFFNIWKKFLCFLPNTIKDLWYNSYCIYSCVQSCVIVFWCIVLFCTGGTTFLCSLLFFRDQPFFLLWSQSDHIYNFPVCHLMALGAISFKFIKKKSLFIILRKLSYQRVHIFYFSKLLKSLVTDSKM